MDTAHGLHASIIAALPGSRKAIITRMARARSNSSRRVVPFDSRRPIFDMPGSFSSFSPAQTDKVRSPRAIWMPTRLKRRHEFRDPIHDFVSLDRQERLLIDTEPFQRLRHIHQLALTYLVYPGASHRRFEHSIGVMDLAGKVFDVVTDEKNRHPDTDHIFPDKDNLHQSKTALRLAALCHDLGHLPFSHAAEKELLPKGTDHESLTKLLINHESLKNVWSTGAYINLETVTKLAVGKKKMKDTPFSDWEAILSEIITGDSFGVDRIDYLLRDSFHLGVAYGTFDHLKLIESLRILPRSSNEESSREPALGVELGGLHSAEALLLARYFMYEQVYLHPIRRIYDKHLIEFMKTLYGENGYQFDVGFHLSQTDNEVISAMRKADLDAETPGHSAARAILRRGHYKRVYGRNPTDEKIVKGAIEDGRLVPAMEGADLSAAAFLFDELQKEFGSEKLRYDSYAQGSNPNLFPVLMPDNRIEESTELSSILKNMPLTNINFIFSARDISEDVTSWIEKNRSIVLGATR